MSGRPALRRAVPWVLCAVSLALLALSAVLRWRYPAQDGVAPISWLETTVDALGFAGIPVVGALIASRLPANPYGWLWCGVGLAAGVSHVVQPLVRVAGGPAWLGWQLDGWGFVSLVVLILFVFLLFPTGRLPTRRWRWLSRAAVTDAVLLTALVPLIDDPSDPAGPGPWVLTGAAGRYALGTAVVCVYVMVGLVLLAMVSPVLRFRRAGPVERRQLAWFLYATVVNGVILVVDAVLGVLPAGLLGATIDAAGFALLPVAVAIAVLRYRLYEIDRIVSRTVSYGLLTAGLLALYFGLVALLRTLLAPVTGSSALAVAGSTLAVAAAFNPARRRLQAGVDRRFDRARYDAGRAVDAFAARLRDQVDLDEISTGLRETVTATVAPSCVAVWLRVPSSTAVES